MRARGRETGPAAPRRGTRHACRRMPLHRWRSRMRRRWYRSGRGQAPAASRREAPPSGRRLRSLLLGLRAALAVPALEALDPTTGVDELLLAREEGMALVAE